MYAKKLLLNVSFFFLVTLVNAQEGTVSGTLTDNTGEPLPGVTIVVKGTTNGTITDFDGNYEILCKVSDVLVFSFIGMNAKEVLVTPEMFDENKNNQIPENIPIPVKKIVSSTYEKLSEENLKINKIPDITQPSLKFHKSGNNQNFQRISSIKKDSNRVVLTYFKPDIYFEIGLNSSISNSYINNKNLPLTQNVYSQGQPFNNNNTWFGPHTNQIFSFGPLINNLEYDGSNYAYDPNGELVPLGSGNGNRAKAYNNNPYQNATDIFNSAYLKIYTNKESFKIGYYNKSMTNIFDSEKSSHSSVSVNYNNKNNYSKKVKWNSFVNYYSESNNQPNTSGFYNNLLLNALATPSSFNNNTRYRFDDNSQRSFAPEYYNNPHWLLNTSRNYRTSQLFTFSLQNEFRVTDDINIYSKINYTNEIDDTHFGYKRNTAGFQNGLLNVRKFNEDLFNAQATFNLNSEKISITSTFEFIKNHLDYDFSESLNLNDFTFNEPRNIISVSKSPSKNTLNLLNKVQYTLDDYSESKISFSNQSFLSSVQENNLFLPTIELSSDINEWIGFFDWMDNFRLYTFYAQNAKDQSLYYKNKSHNSLLISPEESMGYLANHDLFIHNDLKLEQSESFETGFDISLLYSRLNLEFNVHHTINKNAVFPVIENSDFKLSNVADISNKGFEATIEGYITDWNSDFKLITSLSLFKNRTKVLRTNNNENIAIAGFNNVSKKLIKGQEAGVLVGSTYLRDDLNNIIIDNEGYPMVDPNEKIIGNPNPDFNIGFNSSIEWKNLILDIVIDTQIGGDVWNGTQSALNYLGRSEETSQLRNTTNYIFEGVDVNGNVNTIPVDFANPENGLEGNRWVKYGFSGVAEDAIEDGSYLNFKTISLSYNVSDDNKFFKNIRFSLYAENLFTLTRFRGATPYSSLYDNSTAKGLNFFNTPIISEIGFKINMKI